MDVARRAERLCPQPRAGTPARCDRRRHLLLAIAALVLFVAAPAAAAEVERDVVEFLRALHDGDPARLDRASRTLRERGLSDEQIDRLRTFDAAEPDTRAALTREMESFDPRVRPALLAHLLNDPDASVRAGVLEHCGQLLTSPSLRDRVRAIAADDRDLIARGRAQLLVAEWAAAAPRAPAADKENAERPDPFLRLMGAPAVEPLAPPGGELAPADTAPQKSPVPSGDSPSDTTIADSLFSQAVPYWEKPPPYDGVLRLSAADRMRPSEPAPAPRELPLPGDGPDLFGRLRTSETDDGLQPDLLNRPIQPLPVEAPVPPDEMPPEGGMFGPLLSTEIFPTLGFSGPSGVLPREAQENSHFVPVEDRWRIGFPPWDRYGMGPAISADYPYAEGSRFGPYRQNIIKGDYPVFGQHTFFNVLATNITIDEFRQLPTPTTPFESTARPGEFGFFGNPNQYFLTSTTFFQMSLFHGNSVFKPADWTLRITPAFNGNYLAVNELGVVNPDVRRGTDRLEGQVTLQEYFAEAKLLDDSPYYDFASVRAGNQLFNSDFRGFILFDVNRAVRVFGTRLSNRDQFNLIFFDQVEKNTNSFLNTFSDRHQNSFVANYYRQDFVVPGYTAQMSFHYNNDGPSFELDKNNFLVRPDPVGVFRPHQVQAYYFGFAGDGHFDRINITNAFYWVTGHDGLNPLAGQPQHINAQFAALELSYDRDWIRFRTSYLYASGDDNILDRNAKGFDSILDNPFFAGGAFSYWVRQQIPLFRVNLVQRESIVPDLRSSKFQGQSNFVNPGLHLFNLGADFEVTPKLKYVLNTNFLFFDHTNVLQQFVFQDHIARSIGTDVGGGFEYRPLLSDNIILVGGAAALFPGAGFKDLFGSANAFSPDASKNTIDAHPLAMAFLDMILNY